MKVYWQKCGRGQRNLGDGLTALLLDYFDVPCEWAPPDKAELFGVGSILAALPREYRGIVWSTGALFDDSRHDLSAATVLAVRGKLTLARLKIQEQSAPCLGDGGLLVSLFTRPQAKRYKLGVVPHYTQIEEPLFARFECHPEITRIDVCDDPREVIEQIGQCEYIISSSLHGLIVADGLGIPNCWIEVAGNSSAILGNGFKFFDYYSIFGIDNAKPVRLSGGCELDDLLPLFEDYRRPGIDKLKSALLESLRDVVESRSSLSWKTARQDILCREMGVRRRLESSPRPIADDVSPGIVPSRVRGSELVHEQKPIPRRDTAALCRMFLDLLSQLQKLHNSGITHGDVRDANVRVNGAQATLINFGWRAAPDNSSPAATQHIAEDLCGLGRLLKVFGRDQPLLKTIAGLLLQSTSDKRFIGLETAACLIRVVLADEIDSDIKVPHLESNSPEFLQLAESVRMLLENIATNNRELSELRKELKEVYQSWWKHEVRLAALELARAVPSRARYALIDGGEWQDEWACEANRMPVLEGGGTCGGPPEDDETAIQQLKQLQRCGAEYVVVGKPAFWWLDCYPGFRNYLLASAECCHQDDLIAVFRMRTNNAAEWQHA
jgi:hypothetical protein